jgi:hypothetical protein
MNIGMILAGGTGTSVAWESISSLWKNKVNQYLRIHWKSSQKRKYRCN